jgi:hypothetical protein
MDTLTVIIVSLQLVFAAETKQIRTDEFREVSLIASYVATSKLSEKETLVPDKQLLQEMHRFRKSKKKNRFVELFKDADKGERIIITIE